MRKRAWILAAALVAAAFTPAGGEPAPRAARPVPILMYHVIGPVVRGAPYPDLYVARRDFAAQMGWLAQRGYRAVTLRRVYDAWRGRATLPRRPVVVSFDDGYRTHYTNALPILRSHGWPGVENLEVNNEHRPWGLSAARVHALLRAGWELDAHTISHPDLTTLDAAALAHEVAGSRSLLRRQFHVPVAFFCYPAGRYDDAVIAEVRRAGYLGATTTNYGLATPGDLFTLKRVRVNGSDGPAGFAAKLRALA